MQTFRIGNKNNTQLLGWSGDLNTYKVMPPELSGFRKGRCPADAIGDLATDFEGAKYRRDTSYVVYLDVCRAYEFHPHDTILFQLRFLEL